jgi:hypothetical protein
MEEILGQIERRKRNLECNLWTHAHNRQLAQGRSSGDQGRRIHPHSNGNCKRSVMDNKYVQRERIHRERDFTCFSLHHSGRHLFYWMGLRSQETILNPKRPYCRKARAKKCESLGAGGLLVTSFDRDGTQDGYDLELTSAISGTVSIPVIASGGVGKLEHLYEGVVKGGATVLLAA